ncbi:MAG: DUF2207 domain-containing protein, partial [Candidatus Gottesmanbacteria bacterium]|nr:DUF2207 domain-containing protein [Candidatus Gottesmanbacteria bacterium]
MMKKIFIFILSLFCFVVPAVVRAQSAEHIQSYGIDITIRKDGSIHVTERIEYFFDSPRHGIFRNIPVVKTNENGKKYVMTLGDISVLDEQGGGYQFSRSRDGDNEVLKIGDADKTITGTHWYVISY